MKRHISTLTAACAAVFLSTATIASAAGFHDTFDSNDPGWFVDRYAPAGFGSYNLLGENVLKLDISTADSAANRPGSFSGAFYNTQGKKRTAVLNEPWRAYGSLYITSDMLEGANLRRTDLWVGGSDFPIFGIIRNNALDPFNPLASLLTTLRVWDPEAGGSGWVNLSTPLSVGRQDLAIESYGGVYSYFYNNALVYTDATITAPGNAGEVFVQGYNFGDSNYSVMWDDVGIVPVPEPTSMSLAAIGGLSLLFVRRRR